MPARSMPEPGQVFVDIWRWNRSASAGSPNFFWTATITCSTVSRCGSSKGSFPVSKSPIISNMKGPTRGLPLCPTALAGEMFQLRPVQIVPSGAIVMCWAMSLNPRSRVWNSCIASIDSSPRYWAWFGRHVWCMWTTSTARVNGKRASISRNWVSVRGMKGFGIGPSQARRSPVCGRRHGTSDVEHAAAGEIDYHPGALVDPCGRSARLFSPMIVSDQCLAAFQVLAS